MVLRPTRGGFLRPFGCGWFIREFLLGNGPEGSPKIDPKRGAVTEDIFYHYKLALHRAYAEDAVAWENEARIKAGIAIYTPEEYAERVDWHLRRMPYKLVKARYHSKLWCTQSNFPPWIYSSIGCLASGKGRGSVRRAYLSK